MRLVLKGLRRLEWEARASVSTETPPGYGSYRVLCCAICRTDAKMWEQGHRDLALPVVPGHEMVVENDGGDRFVVWPGKNCGTCSYCLQSRENLCESMEITGFHNDGGFADRVRLPEQSLIPIPKDLDPHVGCFAEPVACVVNVMEKMPANGAERILIYGGGTMGLIAALYALDRGSVPLVIEKSAEKMEHIRPFLQLTGVECVKETTESEFDAVINACPDFIAFANSIVKVKKAGHISFFSGLSKNESIETNLLNLIHYKEAVVCGAYGPTRNHMKQAVPFLQHRSEALTSLIQRVVPPQTAPSLMKPVLSGKHLKYIIDFGLAPTGENRVPEFEHTPSRPAEKFNERKDVPSAGDREAFFQKVIGAIEPVAHDLLAAATEKMDEKTKPLGALGKLEGLAIRMCLIQKTLNPVVAGKNIFVFAADHGIAEEGVSAYPAEVTGQMVDNFLRGGAAINSLCEEKAIDLAIIDMGVKKEFEAHPRLIRKKVAMGTGNFALQPAMTRPQMIQAMAAGMEVFLQAHAQKPIDIVGLGEMGIGNTTSASAIISVITGIPPAQATGRGTGMDDKGLIHKTEVIEKALRFHCLPPDDGFEILQKIGGFEIAGMVGAALAAAANRCAVMMDGAISTAAGLVAQLIHPELRGYLISGHRSVEQAQQAALSMMEISPVVDLDMRLGEGTGAALAIDMVSAACRIMRNMASFDEARISRSTVTPG